MTDTARVCFEERGQSVYVHFSVRLQWRGSDFNVYANTGFTSLNGVRPKTSAEKLGRVALAGMVETDQHILEPDSRLLRAVLIALMQDDSGVNSITVKPYELSILRSLAVPVTDIKTLTFTAAREAGYEVIEVDENGQPLDSSRKPFWVRVIEVVQRPAWVKLNH